MNYILLAAGRSGSTLLTNYLSSHPVVRCHHEPFNQTGWHNEIKHYDRALNALNHLEKKGLTISNYKKLQSLGRSIVKRHNGSTHVDPFKKSKDIKCEGFKLTWAQGKPMLEDLGLWLTQNAHIKCVFLYRFDFLARYVSYKLSRKNKVWHSNSKPRDATPFEVDPVEFKAFCHQQQTLEQDFLTMLTNTKTNTFITSYEDLCKAPLSRVNEVFSFLRCPSINALKEVTTKLVVQDLESLVLNYKSLNSAAVNIEADEKRKRAAQLLLPHAIWQATKG
ncbi:hypothetical protein NBRC116583_00060 [Arenicella sp. 4NH20-0111]|uniref:hypothetical protein n=1 Tax=Arenicella sp. 4NH20-0111 TaxID=3127648 RepID=UPI003103EAA8